MLFSDALQFLQDGQMVQREGWNGKGMFVFRQIPATIDIEIIPNMQSLPDTVKAEFVTRGKSIHYNNQFAIVNQDNQINSWVPSVSDIQAEDWGLFGSD
ncbi:hypothetical protein LCGC14_0938010 [marine sediment metagenome]|uniref:Thoeris anti-defense 2-like domain-containing protein n=1 Tax=marine sediment metagenome TaxID=412755 RepID=A0A0F9NQL2_9ZZZZ|nr:DUF2829 domain-containing protein [Pricia sp.]